MVVGPNIKPGVIVMFFGFLGIIFAALEQYLQENGYILDAYLQGGVDLVGLQVVTIVVFMLLGCVVAIFTSDSR